MVLGNSVEATFGALVVELTEVELLAVAAVAAAFLYFPFPLLPFPLPWPAEWWGGW